MSPFILPLDHPSTLEQAGGKGLNLQLLTAAGFPVPAGFIVATSAYNCFVQHNRLAFPVAEALQSLHPQNLLSCERVSTTIRRLFRQGEIPPDIIAAINEARAKLGAGLPLAVRSSATAEDLPSASFAGQGESYLNIAGKDDLPAAVRACWSSLWTARAIAYRTRLDLASEQVAMAVLVQKMVQADASGVLFTVNPLNGNADELVINAAWGLGEALVCGQVTPDTLIGEKKTGCTLSLTAGHKELMTIPATEGTRNVPVPLERQDLPVLSAKQAEELIRLGLAIEQLFGTPQDIEWAISGNLIFILQARPVTAFPDPPTPATDTDAGHAPWPAPLGKRPHPFDLWTRVDLGERWPQPVTPLTWSFFFPLDDAEFRRSFRNLSSPYLDQIQWTKRFFGRVYLNEGAIGHVSSRELGIPLSFAKAIIGSTTSESGNGGQDRPKPWRFLFRLPGALAILLERLRAESAFAKLFPQIDHWVDDFSAKKEPLPDDAKIWNDLVDIWLPKFKQSFRFHADVSINAMSALPILEWLLTRWGQRPESACDLITGLSGLHNAAMIPAFWQMAQLLRSLPLPPEALESPSTLVSALGDLPEAAPLVFSIEAFLKRYGHRAPNELELLSPRWSEAPENVGAAILGYLRSQAQEDPALITARQRVKQAATASHIGAGLSPIRRLAFRKVLERTHHLVRLRDNGQHYVVKLLLPIRRTFATLGERWTGNGWLNTADEIFFLPFAEIERTVMAGSPQTDLKELVRNNRATYQYYLAMEAPDAIGPDGQPRKPELAQTDPSVLLGIAVSSGAASGTARVVHSLAEAMTVPPGTILVTKATDPGWTPVFPLLQGLVLEIGGPLSHGAIIARECGLPAVVNVPAATHRIQDGQAITVDGNTGCVHLPPSVDPLPGPHEHR